MPEVAETPIQILLVDDHALFREGLARLLGSETDFEVAGDCGSVQEALNVLGQKSIDIVLLDCYAATPNGRAFLALARRHGFNGKVLLVTGEAHEGELADLIRAGISGIFRKRDSSSLLGQAIRSVFAGRVWFKQEQLLTALTGYPKRYTSTQNNRFTEREQQVLSYVLDGLASRKIAERVGVSTGSVKAILQQLFSKTGVRTRSQLVRIVLEQYKDRRL